jgi:molybdopterin synthase catalytic subunit
MKNTIKTEELTKLQNLITVIGSVKDQIGQTEVQKHIFLHKFDLLSQELAKFKNELREAYGDVSIDHNTGEFTKIEENESNTED